MISDRNFKVKTPQKQQNKKVYKNITIQIYTFIFSFLNKYNEFQINVDIFERHIYCSYHTFCVKYMCVYNLFITNLKVQRNLTKISIETLLFKKKFCMYVCKKNNNIHLHNST